MEESSEEYDKIQALMCFVCDKSFAKTSNLYKHIRDVHKENVHFPTRKILCPTCPGTPEEFNTYEQLNLHLETDHSMHIQVEDHKFNNMKEFDLWKTQVEETTVSQYVKAAGVRKSGSIEKLHYNCNRTGFFQTDGQRRRKLKSKGSCKINANCPSRIKVTRDCKTGSVDVNYVATHVGHKQELDHLVLTKSDRQWVGSQLLCGKGIEEILDFAHSNLVEKSSRLNLLTRKDVLNIRSALGMSEGTTSNPLTVINEVVCGNEPMVSDEINNPTDSLKNDSAIEAENEAEAGGNLYICIDENGETRQIQVIKLVTKCDTSIPKETLQADIEKQMELITDTVANIENNEVLQTVSSLLQTVNQYIRFRK